MSAVYYLHKPASTKKDFYTGGHDGTINCWNFETGQKRYELHEKDPTCTSKNHIKESKSVDCIIVLEEKKKLCTLTADQTLRFWNLNEA